MVEYKCHGTIAECLECPYTDECDRDVTLEEERVIDNVDVDIYTFNIGQLIELRRKAESKKEYNRYTNAIYRIRNKQKVRERQREWVRNHPEQNNAHQKKYYYTHQEEINEKKRRYYKENREAILERKRERRKIS